MRFIPLMVLAFALLVPAAAQAATVNLEASQAPAEEEVTAGESVDLSFDVQLTVSDTSCVSEVELPMNATASLEQGATAEPTPFSFTIPAGDYNIAGEHQDDQSVTVTVETEPGVTEEYNMDIGLQAAFDGLSPDECATEFPATESDSLTTTLVVQPDEEPEEEAPGEDEEDSDQEDDPVPGEPDDVEEEDETPLPGLIALVAVSLAALLRRR